MVLNSQHLISILNGVGVDSMVYMKGRELKEIILYGCQYQPLKLPHYIFTFLVINTIGSIWSERPIRSIYCYRFVETIRSIGSIVSNTSYAKQKANKLGHKAVLSCPCFYILLILRMPHRYWFYIAFCRLLSHSPRFFLIPFIQKSINPLF